MSSLNQNPVDDLLAKIQKDAAAIQTTADAGGSDSAAAAAALDHAAASIAEIAGEMEPAAAGPPSPQKPATAVPGSFDNAPRSSPRPAAATDIRRLLAIEVPVIVQLGMRRLTVSEVMRLAVGAIVEFGKSADEELDLLVNNKPVGKGHAVKVGENFGIKITTIDSVKDTIRKLGAV